MPLRDADQGDRPAAKFGRRVPKGVYAPLITPFKADQSVDVEIFKRHVQYVAGAGGALLLRLRNQCSLSRS